MTKEQIEQIMISERVYAGTSTDPGYEGGWPAAISRAAERILAMSAPKVVDPLDSAVWDALAEGLDFTAIEDEMRQFADALQSRGLAIVRINSHAPPQL